MQPNDLNTFMESIAAGKPYVVCPACGNHMMLRDISSYRMALADNARDELNRAVQAFRNILMLTEAELARINRFGVARPDISEQDYPHQYEREVFVGLQPDGTYANSVAAGAARKLITSLDIFEFKKHFHQIAWRPHSKSPMAALSKEMGARPETGQSERGGRNGRARRADVFGDALHQDPAIKLLLNGLEKASVTGPLIDLIMDQERIAGWVQRATTETGIDLHPDLGRMLDEVCPHYAQYLDDIAAQQPADDPAETIRLRQRILHTQLVLIIFLGHAVAQAKQLSRGLFDGNLAFELPGTTYVSDHYRLEQLLSSHLVLKACRLGWSEDIAAAVGVMAAPDSKGGAAYPAGTRSAAPQDNGDDIAKIETILKADLDKLIRFKCSGPAGAIAAGDTANNSERRQAFCGWYPKDADTYPVVLLGSPGCGKSTVMLTGLLAFCESIAALGAEVSFDRPEDMELYNRYSSRYWAGELPKPNPIGSRQSIHLKVQQTTGTSRKSAYFVFTDIPGEMLTACLEGSGPSSALLGILGAAEAIVFFFDMTIENSIRLALCNQKEEIGPGGKSQPLGEGANIWLRLAKSVDKVKSDRNNRFVEYSQLNLLNKVIENLQMKQGTANGGVLASNFICVLPKIDLFANLEEDDDPHMFFNEFFEYLVANELIYRSPYTYGDNYAGLLSAAGIGSTFFRGSDGADRSSNLVEISRGLSDQALAGLGNIGKAFYHHNPDQYPEAVRMREMLQAALISELELHFKRENIYFLPVCAQGQRDKYKDGHPDGQAEKADPSQPAGADIYQRTLGGPPNQKLAEFVFMLPVALSLMARASPAPAR